eukprot:894004-Amphidinium_carterae.2
MWVCADASFAPTGDASHEGMCFKHGGSSEDIFQGNLIHWKSNKQTLVTKSSCEAELLALVSAAETTEILGLYDADRPARIQSLQAHTRYPCFTGGQGTQAHPAKDQSLFPNPPEI